MSEFESRLPVYQAKRSEAFPAFLIVTCGYDDCPGAEAKRPFLVAEKEWLRPVRYKPKSARQRDSVLIISGRACPYCFRAGRLPKRSEIE
jgi:hypothetical protein